LSERARIQSRRRRLALASAPLLLAAVALVLAHAGAGAGSRAGAQPAQGEPTAQTDASVPASDVTLFGASPAETPGETWGLGTHEGAAALVRYTTAGGWSAGSALLDAEGNPIEGFALEALLPEGAPSPLAGSTTAAGSGVLIGTAEKQTKQVVLVRNPGGAFQETLAEPGESGEAVLKAGEKLFGQNRPPLIAALDEGGGTAGAFVVPVDQSHSVEEAVLHWDGQSKTWTRETIAIPAKSAEQFEVLAIGASSATNAWLIAKLSPEAYPAGSIALYRRRPAAGSEPASWQPVALKSGGEAGEPLAVETQEASSVQFTVPGGDQAQLLTVTPEGLWIEGQRREEGASSIIFLRPEGEAEARYVASWCERPTSAAGCRRELPEALPTGPSRSFAWANSSTPEHLGELVITGFGDGVSWRLEGAEFKRVLALGAGADKQHGGHVDPQGDVGGIFGSAFSSPVEGWLGQEQLPVHLTLAPAHSRLTAWPASFRYPLLAVAPQPGAPVGALSSEALAVGEHGDVARYVPGDGWLPEPLLGPGGRKTPRLRAVAWPTPTRAYAVGDLGEMWLWRGETGLWEPDPATPENFRGNLLGIAFDPAEPARGYAVGQAGTLLRYGKTWAQEPTCGAEVQQPCLPPEVAGANFTSIAFAGSEALVAYRKLVKQGGTEFSGGLLVNEGSGWHVDTAAATAMGSDVPWAAAGLPDGGAGFTASGDHGTHVYERESSGVAWQAVSSPGLRSPGSLALFREGGVLRAVVAGREPQLTEEELNELTPPPGSPPLFVNPYPVELLSNVGVLRQTASGWSDEEHELNTALEPPGEYKEYDGVYTPDPVAAVLVGENGEPGWAVGGLGYQSSATVLDTGDVWRYREESAAPTGLASAPVAASSGDATFAIGGNAECAAPCADRANARIGPDVWLSGALSAAEQIPGLRAFFYTGPRVTSGATLGSPIQTVPYASEFERYSAVLGARRMPVYAAASETDLKGGAGLFESAFSGFAQPFGDAPAAAGMAPAAAQASCPTPGAARCGLAYAMRSEGNQDVRVLVLEPTSSASPNELPWLSEQLAAAAAAGEPAIAIGNSNLYEQTEKQHNPVAQQLAETLVAGHASAYFFDSPEQNIRVSLHDAAGKQMPSFGSGTLGYIRSTSEETSEFLGTSGFMLVHVAPAALEANVHEVTVKLVPDIGELAMEAESGTLVKRSRTALFRALARRQRAGSRWHAGTSVAAGSLGTGDPYVPIPPICVGSGCSEKLETEYSFSSSNPEVGQFVAYNEAVGESTVLLGANGKPIPDPASGLFCAYNAGTTIVTITAGGLSASLPVTVQAGSVEQPCGTTRLNKPPSKQQAVAPPPPPPPTQSPAPTGTAPATAPPLLPPAPAVPAVPARPAPPSTPFFISPALQFLVPAFVPPPLPAPANPTPPSGTSAVTSPVEAAQREEEPESAPESVSNQAVAYRQAEHEPPAGYLLGVVLLAAFAGASLRGRPDRRGRESRVVLATINATRAQRRYER
jgi:hypothetical protein